MPSRIVTPRGMELGPEARDAYKKLRALLEAEAVKYNDFLFLSKFDEYFKDEDAWRDKPVYDGYSHRELEKALSGVVNPDDWRAPIYARVPRGRVAITMAAVIFFTGTVPKIVQDIPGRPDVTIESEGYRNGPCGP